MAWRINFESHFAVKPDTTLALVGIAMAADRSILQLVELLVLDVKPMLKVADAVLLVFIVESWADIELPIGSKRDSRVACSAVVHLLEHHAVGKKVQLWRFAFNVHLFDGLRQLFEQRFLCSIVLVGECLYIH